MPLTARRSRLRHVAAAATTASTAAALLNTWQPKASKAPRAWVPPRAIPGLGRPQPQRKLSGQLLLPRRSTAVADIEQVVKEDVDEEEKLAHPLMLVLSCLMGPALCYIFVRFRTGLNTFLMGYGAMFEFGVYTTVSLLLLLVLKSGVIGKSASSFIYILCSVVDQFHGGRSNWASEALRKLSRPLENISQSVILFLTVNLFVNAIPETCAWQVPHLMRFMDLNGDGTLEAEEIEAMAYRLTSKMLGVFAVWQVGLFLHNLRQPLKNIVPDRAQGPIASWFRCIQRMKMKVRRQPGVRVDLSNHAVVWILDVMFAFVSWVGVAYLWVSIVGIPLHAVATALAPLGIGGLAFSLASKNIVQNIISGVLIFLNRAFVEGDEIHSVDGKITGVVAKVGLINTEVLRLQGDPVVVPNTELVSNGIVNLQRRDFWLIDATLPLYMPTMERLTEVVGIMDKTLKEKVADIAFKPGGLHKSISVFEEPLCYFEGFGHQGATIKARAYVDGTLPRHRFYKVRSEVLLALNDIAFSFQGTGIAFEGHILSNGRKWAGAGEGDDGHGGHDSGHGEGH